MPGNRRSIRLKDYDYTRQGAYYVTLCADGHVRRGGSRAALTIDHNVFGHVKNGKMMLNNIGKIVHDSWLCLANQYDYVNLDEFIVMPNHMHGIIFLGNAHDGIVQGASRGEGGSRAAPTATCKSFILRKPLGQLIGAFKTVSTKQINMVNNTHGNRLWQRNFYEHVIRDESDLARIREYIVNNPANWEKDEYYC